MSMPVRESCGSSSVPPLSSFGFPMGSLAITCTDLAQRLDEDLLRLSRQRDDSAGLVVGHAGALTGFLGDCPALPRLSGPGVGTDQRSNR
jgi:hypothetical protein